MEQDNAIIDQMSRLTDEEIVGKVQLGEVELFGLLVKRYEVKMFRYEIFTKAASPSRFCNFKH